MLFTARPGSVLGLTNVGTKKGGGGGLGVCVSGPGRTRPTGWLVSEKSADLESSLIAGNQRD